MLCKTTALYPAALLGGLSLVASAKTMNQEKLEVLRNASLTIQQAGHAALQAHTDRLASVIFGDENGRVAYEVVVIGADSQPWEVLLDAWTSKAFASTLSSSIDDHEDEGEGQDDGDQDGCSNVALRLQTIARPLHEAGSQHWKDRPA